MPLLFSFLWPGRVLLFAPSPSPLAGSDGQSGKSPPRAGLSGGQGVGVQRTGPASPLQVTVLYEW